MTRLAAGACLLAAVALACAQPQAPPGGEPDRTPPRVIAVSPAPFDTVTDPGTPVVIEFDERISERFEGVQELEDAVIVSPATGAVRVERGRRSIEIRMRGGWREGLVYRVVVLPVLRDLFNNVRAEPVDLVFSTGAPIPETAVAGFVTDPITGESVAGARIEAVRRLDEITYVAVTDTSGFFSMRHVPAGAYDVRVWQDQDRDLDVDFAEPHRLDDAVLTYGDTLLLDLALLPGDTTPARLLAAEPIDTITIRLLFDDHIPVGPVDQAASVYALPDSTLVLDGALLHGSRLDSLTAARRAAADSARIAADSARADSLARADTLAAPGDTAAADTLPPAPPVRTPAAVRAGADAGAAAAPAQPLPSRELILLLPAPLGTGGGLYAVVVRGITNIRGIGGGGGTARFTAPRPTPPDTAAAPPPPGAAPPDTAGAARQPEP